MMMSLADVIRDYVADEPSVDFVRFSTVYVNGRSRLEMEVTFKDGSVAYWSNASFLGWEMCAPLVPSLTE